MFHLSFLNNSDSTNDDCVKKPCGKYNGPFGATQMWNDLVKAFRTGMPLQRHRKALKRYDNCFMSSDAINWFHLHLKNSPDFAVAITRTQVELLLKKFYDAKVFEEVDKNRVGFQCGNRLYRFCENGMADLSCLLQPNTSPTHNESHSFPSKLVKSYLKTSANKMFSTTSKNSEILERNVPLKTLNATFQKSSLTSTSSSMTSKQLAAKNRMSTVLDSESDPCILVNAGRNMNTSCIELGQRKGQYKQVDDSKDAVTKDFLRSLNSLVDQRDFSQLVYRVPCDVGSIIHNVSIVNKNGIPTNIDKKDQLPLWFVTALKSLASGSLNEKLCNDTIDVVCDFVNLQSKEPLITKDLFNIMMFSFNYLIGAQQRKPISPPVEAPSHASWRDIYRLRFGWKRTDRSMAANADDHSRSVLSTMDAFELIDSTPKSRSPSMQKSLSTLKRDESLTTDGRNDVSIHSPSKPLSFLGGVKQLKRNKKEKKLKNYTSLLLGQGESFEIRPQLSTSIRDLSESKMDESSLRNGIRSEENLTLRTSRADGYSFERESSQTKKMIEILQHIFLMVMPKQRRMLMILIRLLAKSKNICRDDSHLNKLLDTFLTFLLISPESSGSEVSTARKILRFLMEFYSEIFKVPQPLVDSVLRLNSKVDLKDKENVAFHIPATNSRDKVAGVNFPKSILKKSRLEAIRF